MASLLFAGAPHLLGCKHASFSGKQLALRSTPRVATPITTITHAGQIGPLKKWETYPLTANGKPLRNPMPMKTGDTVKIISGHDKGKIGKVTKVVLKMGQIVVEDVNIKTRHNKPVREGEAGTVTEKESPIHHSNAMLYSRKDKIASRIGYRVNTDGNKVRYLRKNDEELP